MFGGELGDRPQEALGAGVLLGTLYLVEVGGPALAGGMRGRGDAGGILGDVLGAHISEASLLQQSLVEARRGEDELAHRTTTQDHLLPAEGAR